MRIIFLSVFFLLSSALHALEIDEKLTLRLLKISNSKKTVLINRGAEDGLVVGDHAKFFVTSGVIARGVVEKVSPSRSIWSLYRVVAPDEIIDGKVMNLKIASPVKVTTDPTKSMKEEEVPAGNEGMDMAGNTAADTNIDEENELREMGLEEAPPVREKRPAQKTKKEVVAEAEPESEDEPFYSGKAKIWEVWGMVYMDSLGGKDQDDNTIKESNLDLTAGVEFYLLKTKLFKNASLLGILHKKTASSSAANGAGGTTETTKDALSFGAGANYHFYNAPDATNKPIGYIGFSAGTGSVVNKVTDVDDQKWSTSFYSFAIGSKYVFNSGFGFKVALDYLSTTEAYETFKYTLAGPRFQVGVSYRF